MNILVTGGAGYIGSHTCVELLNSGFAVTVIDNLSNSKEEPLNRVQKITGKKLEFIKADLLDQPALKQVFSKTHYDSVIHFAGKKAVGESVRMPLAYYRNNLVGTINLLETMIGAGVKNLVFSSSATVYGQPDKVPITEDFPLKTFSPYGRTKLMIEDILRDVSAADPSLNIAILRYFNPIGAHPSGSIGENPAGIPNNLMPYISQVAVGKLKELQIFGGDYSTPDGTGIRDYIHVSDLAAGHIKALEKLSQNPGLVTYNLGTGQGISVLELVTAFEKASGQKIPYKIVPCRPGDVALCFADPSRAQKELGWRAKKTINEMCVDTWRWQSQNPHGY